MTAATPEHIGLTWRIQAGREAEYDRRHARMWPLLERRLRELGVHAFAIYRLGEVAFAHLEVDDYRSLVDGYGTDALAEAWERDFADLIAMDRPDPATGWPERLRHVWSLSATNASRTGE